MKKIKVMDEATAAVDFETDSVIQTAIHKVNQIFIVLKKIKINIV